MSLTTFVAMAILGIDFLIYAFFQWTYGEKHRSRPHKKVSRIMNADNHASRPYLIHSRPASNSHANGWNERLAHHTIVSAFPPPRR